MEGLYLERNYIFHEYTKSLCSYCHERIDGKIIFKDNKVWILKQCPEHGLHEELLEDDINYFLKRREYDKPGTITTVDTEFKKGCPYDCGICPEHDQHTCIGLIEVTHRCNLNCDMCYAKGEKHDDLDLETIERMIDYYQKSENNQAEILQISGGEPTLHKNIIKIIEMGQEKKIKYIMLNTNGIRISEDEKFVEELSRFKGGFEVYLQFDSFSDSIYKDYRDKSMIEIKMQAIENLIKHKIPMTLVVTVSKLNINEIGKIIQFAMDTKYIRGINFQPIAYYTITYKDIDIKNRVTLSTVLNAIECHTNGLIQKNDFIPLPCNVERVAVTYLLKSSKGFIPVMRNTNVKDYLSIINNTLNFDMDEILKQESSGSVCKCLKNIKTIHTLVPRDFIFKSKQEKLRYVDENTFRMTVTSFIDGYNFDMKSAKKECVHVITPDLKRIPFSMYNLLHRKGDNYEYSKTNATI